VLPAPYTPVTELTASFPDGGGSANEPPEAASMEIGNKWAERQFTAEKPIGVPRNLHLHFGAKTKTLGPESLSGAERS
jgi:hypothetical protein